MTLDETRITRFYVSEVLKELRRKGAIEQIKIYLDALKKSPEMTLSYSHSKEEVNQEIEGEIGRLRNLYQIKTDELGYTAKELVDISQTWRKHFDDLYRHRD